MKYVTIIAMKSNRRYLIGNIAIYVSLLIPVIFWLIMAPIGNRLLSASTIFISLGQVSGLIGFVLFSITLILSARIKFLETYFGGQNIAYINHYYFGATAFILLLLHPVFLAIRYLLISLFDAAQFMAPWLQDRDVLLGTIGLSLMIIALFFTFYKHLPYQIWKLTHKFLGLAFFFGSMHMFIIDSDVSSYMPLRIYMIFFAVVGIVCVIYRVILKKYLVKTYKYIVKNIEQHQLNIFEIVLESIDKKMIFKPGQFAFVSFESRVVSREYHPFSIIKRPDDSELSFIVKSLGDYTGLIGSIKKGDIARVEGPFGLFTLDSTSNFKQIWIAGGIGITPFLSIARSLDKAHNEKQYSIDFYYSVKSDAELIFVDELKTIAMRTGKIRIFTVISDRDGRLDVEKIMKNSNSNSDVFICGPAVMTKSLRDQFISIGFLSKNIHSEEFTLQ